MFDGLLPEYCQRLTECRENWPVSVRHANKSHKIPYSAMVREVEK